MTGPRSLRARLLLAILLPVAALVAFNTASLYRRALENADTAYDRTLLASAKAIGEGLEVVPGGGGPRVRAAVAYSALEPFEVDHGRLYYKVTGFDGEVVAGFDELPLPRDDVPDSTAYAALVKFYNDRYRGEAVRMAVLQQPVTGVVGQGMAVVQVAETLEVRQGLTRSLLIDTAWRQALLLAVIAAVVVVAVQVLTRPLRAMSEALRSRTPDDLSVLDVPDVPMELAPVQTAINSVMSQTARLVDHQKRFVRDASHQLRTPLAALKTQVQSAQRGDLPPEQALHEIGHTVEGAIALANQMLKLAKVEQMRQHTSEVADWAEALQAVALDLAPLIAQARLDFDIALDRPVPVQGHEWMLRELSRNLLHNAVRHSPRGGPLHVRLAVQGGEAVCSIVDGGPGLSAELRSRLYQPFATSASGDAPGGGSGLGLTICREIVDLLGGRIDLVNREEQGRVVGLDARVVLPLAR
ncbi:MAG: sensor histidine kinase N-terminal domain-containing protein [Rhizobacter sp.]|nr:sensor histidine kinase N-terminal domain-containing protein [Rhizobacter sp.]